MSFRKGVAIILLSADSKQILLGERAKQPGQWQIPQGGTEAGETAEQTLERELFEEVGIALPKILDQTTEYISYEWPKELFKKGRHVGQEHIYFLLDGSGVNINTLRPSKEFSHFKWAPIADAVQMAVAWKREALTSALRDLKLLK